MNVHLTVMRLHGHLATAVPLGCTHRRPSTTLAEARAMSRMRFGEKLHSSLRISCITRRWVRLLGGREGGGMRTRALLCRLRKLHDVLHVVPQAEADSGLLLARGISSYRVADSVRGANAGGLLHAQQNSSASVGSVRMMGVGSFKEGNRAGQHGVKYPQVKPDGSPEKQESDAREEFLEKAKASSPSEAQQPIPGTTTELGFGVKDGKNTNEAIANASEELFKQSSINGKPDAGPIKEEDKRKYPEHQTSEPDLREENIGHVSSAGANALDNDDNVPDDAVEWEETGEETLDKAQKMHEQAVAGFGTGGDKNLKNKPEDTSDVKFHNA